MLLCLGRLTMRDGCRGALPHAERVAANKVGALGKGVVQGVEEEGGGWRQQILDVLLQGVDVCRP